MDAPGLPSPSGLPCWKPGSVAPASEFTADLWFCVTSCLRTAMFTENLVHDTEVGYWIYPSGVMKTKLWKSNP